MSAGGPAARPRGPGGPRVALIVNQAARQGHDRSRVERVMAWLDPRCRLDVAAPESGAATEAAARAFAATHDIVAAAGGDGTVHHVLNGLGGTSTPMGVVPLGTGNDFARALGIPTEPERAARRVLEGAPAPMDLVEVNGRLYGTVGVLGVAAASALQVSRWSSSDSIRGALTRSLGGWSYRVAGLMQLVRPRASIESLSVTIDDEEASVFRDVHAAFVTNGRLLGGGLRLPVDARLDDGRIEVCLVPRMPRARLLRAFFCFAQGRPVPPGILIVSHGARARVDAARAIPFAADGELVCTDSRFAITAHHHALRVIR